MKDKKLQNCYTCNSLKKRPTGNNCYRCSGGYTGQVIIYSLAGQAFMYDGTCDDYEG